MRRCAINVRHQGAVASIAVTTSPQDYKLQLYLFGATTTIIRNNTRSIIFHIQCDQLVNPGVGLLLTDQNLLRCVQDDSLLGLHLGLQLVHLLHLSHQLARFVLHNEHLSLHNDKNVLHVRLPLSYIKSTSTCHRQHCSHCHCWRITCSLTNLSDISVCQGNNTISWNARAVTEITVPNTGIFSLRKIVVDIARAGVRALCEAFAVRCQNIEYRWR